ncbi:MAG: hypothetical protein ABR976_20885 [Terracidiphilus sp.]|jgi:hypothetical protein
MKTPIALERKMMRRTDIRTTTNIHGGVVADEVRIESVREANLAFQSNGAQAERKAS